MIIIYHPDQTPAKESLITTLQEVNLTGVSVECRNPSAVSLALMQAMLRIEEPRRTDLVFLGIPMDVATERFIADSRARIRSVEVTTDSPYAIKTPHFHRAVRANAFSFHTQ